MTTLSPMALDALASMQRAAVSRIALEVHDGDTPHAEAVALLTLVLGDTPPRDELEDLGTAEDVLRLADHSPLEAGEALGVCSDVALDVAHGLRDEALRALVVATVRAAS